MNINLTLFVQIINFFITYLLLSKGLLKPVLYLIQKENADKKKLEQHLAFEQQVVETKQQDKINRLKEVKNYFDKHGPKYEPTDFKSYSFESSVTNLDHQQLKEIVNKSALELKEKIIHG